MLKLFFSILFAASIANAGNAFTGTYQFIDGTNTVECPAYELVVKGNDLAGYSFYGSTGIDARGPFQNSFYFTDVNLGEVRKGSYTYITESTGNALKRSVKYSPSKEVLIEEEVLFKTQNNSAVLDYRLIKNDRRARQWRSSSFKCFYEKI